VPLLVDSTLTSPWLMKPLELGADLVYHSATKFLSGHGTVVGGIVVDGGSFDWAKAYAESGKFEELAAPYAGFHNMNFSEESTVGAFLLRARREGLRDFGACMSPHTAWLILQGVETLGLRMERHISNTEKVVQFLASQPFVAGLATRCWRATPATRWRKSCCHAARARCSALTSRATANKARSSLKPEGLQPPGQCGRLPQPGDPPRQHHAFPHDGRGAGRRWHHPGHDSPVDWTGRCRRSD
jgi:O-acetylhomoserine/O-acetylserine sulfhydrylase-like pyridoxal-dependent enzyme